MFPERQRVSLPLNGLNMLFEDISVTFNHSTKLDSDRYVDVVVVVMSPPPPVHFFFSAAEIFSSILTGGVSCRPSSRILILCPRMWTAKNPKVGHNNNGCDLMHAFPSLPAVQATSA